MGLLAPLYIAGLLAVSLPILFHLIRRAPQGRQVFSSLMFLAASPPRLTRRSRLTNIILLLLRAAALILLALAFARPFFSGAADANANQTGGRRIALLIDTSASMRRGNLWQQAIAQVDQVLKDLRPADEVALFTFDRQVRPAFTFAEWNEHDPSQRAALLRARLAAVSPTWAPTQLGEAMAAVADLLAEGEGPQRATDKTIRQLVLISDMQQGGHAEALQAHQWPANVVLAVRPVALKQPGNASVQVVKQTVEGSDKDDAGRLRVRVDNQADSAREQFTLTWADERGALAGMAASKVYVPPGRSQIVRVPWPAPGDRRPDRLLLQGDECDFDNTLYVVPPRKDSVRLLYVGDDGAEDVKGLLYYLKSAAAESPQRTVELIARRAADPLAETDLLGARLAVVAAALPDDRVAILRHYVEGGGDVLWVMKDVGASKSVARMMGVDELKVDEASGADFALISRVETDHPLFAPFADPRFGDFTKIHFWKHRRVKLDAPAASARVLAWFDGGDPFLFERTIGQGRLLVATSGWHPADSQLALSTKFVPLIDGMLRRRDGAVMEASYSILDPIALPPTAPGEGARTLLGPDGKPLELKAGATTFENADKPGIYRLVLKGEEIPLAVNLNPDESRTAPVAVEELEQWGARLGNQPASDELVTRQRRLELVERENRQKLWRWLIVGVLGLLAAETALAGRLAKRVPQEQATT
jgi:hypothetical protein